MKMPKLEEIRAAIARDWPGDPVAELCERIIAFLIEVPPQELRQLSPTTFARAVGIDAPNELLLKAITILSATSVKILEPHFLFVDDDEKEYEVTRESLRQAQRQGTLEHPNTGNEVADYAPHILPYFSPTEEFMQLRGAAA